MDEVVGDVATLRSTAAWRPMSFSDRHPAEIANPIYEPLWPGHRTLVEVSPGGVTIRGVDVAHHAGAADLQAALAVANLARELVLDGYLVPAPLDRVPNPSPAASAAASAISVRDMARQAFLGGLRRSSRRRPGVRPRAEALPDPLPLDAPMAFVAVDLLRLDGESLLDVPLGERKRLLESVVAEGALVRRVAPVQAPVERMYGGWRALGFREVAVKAANSRYAPGGVSEDWAILAIPHA